MLMCVLIRARAVGAYGNGSQGVLDRVNFGPADPEGCYNRRGGGSARGSRGLQEYCSCGLFQLPMQNAKEEPAFNL